MRKITKLLTLALAAMMIIGMIPFAASAAFEDVSYDDEALYEAVELLSTLGVAKGTTETTFGPEENVTRQQMAAFVYRLMKAGRSSEGGVNTTPFTDLEDNTFFNMISWASNAGIIKGTSATTFNPKGGITLQDAYVMVVRALGYENDGPLSYPFGYTDKAEELGLDENLEAVDYTATLNRGQVAILLANAFYADMNETTVEYEWITNETTNTSAYVPVETTETIAHKIFGVVEETFEVFATTNYAFGDLNPTYDDLKDVETVVGTRYDKDGEVIKAGVEFEMDELGLDCEADELFLAELTVFVKKDAKDVNKDEILAAKSNLIKKTVTAEDIALVRSTKTDKEYYVGGVKSADAEKVMTGVIEIAGMSAYLDYDQAPYSYKKDYEAADGIKFINLVSGTYDEEDGATFIYDDLGIDFQGAYAMEGTNGSFDNLTSAFADEFAQIYNEGLYEADVYDANGDGYIDYLFVKDYTFVEIVDKKNKSFAGLKNFNSEDYFSIYTEDATIEGEYKSGDFVLAYVNADAKYVKVAETIAPIEAMVSARSSSDDSKTVTFKSGEKVEFVDASIKFQAAKYPAYADFKAGKTYKAYIKGDVLLFKDGISGSGNYDADANYAIVLNYDEDPVTKYVVDGEGAEKIEDERIVYSATGVVDGEFVTYFYVNVLVDGAVKAVQLADYANTFVNYDGEYSLNEEIEDQKITDKEVAETVMYNDFLNKFSTFTVDSDGAYTFTALDIETDTSVFADKEEETAVYMTAESATIKNFTGSIYNITGVEGLSKFTLKDYSKLIIKTVDDDGDDVYTVYTAANLPDFAETTFNNVMAIFVNNTKSTYENLGILYAEIDEFASDVVNDYRIVLSATTIADEEGKEKNIYNVLDITTATVTGNVELAKGVVAPAAGTIVLMNEDGKIAGAADIKNAYVEDYMFTATFTGDYEEANKFLNIGDGNTYLITDDTTILYYTSTSVYEMAEDDIFTVEENDYEGLEEATSFNLKLVAEEIDDDTTDETIKVVKSVIVTK